jgi:hypothetical protein
MKRREFITLIGGVTLRLPTRRSGLAQ